MNSTETETADVPPFWKEKPEKTGWYLVWARGHFPDFIFYGGEDDPIFEPVPFAKYFGPIRLPLAP